MFVLEVAAWRENVIRVTFDEPIYYSGLFDPRDAANADKFEVTPNAGTVGYNGEPARPVNVATSTLVREGTKKVLDLTLDRPFTPYPAVYQLRIVNVFNEDQTSSVTATRTVIATYRILTRPTMAEVVPSFDIANPQTLSMAQASLPRAGEELLGTYSTDDTGDYALDSGATSLKKRLYRRVMTRKNAFAHLPGYGIGVPQYIKKLGTAAVQSQLATEAETQFAQEPEVLKCRVLFVPLAADKPNAWIMRSYVKTKAGIAHRFDFPIG